MEKPIDKSSNCFIQTKITQVLINVLFSLHGIPIPGAKISAILQNTVRFIRGFSIISINVYFVYKIYQLWIRRNITAGIFSLINAAGSAGIVDSVAIFSHKFSKFSDRLFHFLAKRRIFLTTGAIFRLGVYSSVLISYVVVCSIMIPSRANHFINKSAKNDTEYQWESHNYKHYLYTCIFFVCSGNVASHFILYFFVCCLLQTILRSLLQDLSEIKCKKSLKEFRSTYIEVADLVRSSDNIFSLMGLVGLTSVLLRACSCIHFYLNLIAPYKDSWIFLLMRTGFDVCCLLASSCFASAVFEEGQKIAPALLRSCQGMSTRNTGFYIQCLTVVKVVMSSNVHFSAWKLFPFTRKVLPTVIGVAISYIAVIIQMHLAPNAKYSFTNSTTAEISIRTA